MLPAVLEIAQQLDTQFYVVGKEPPVGIGVIIESDGAVLEISSQYEYFSAIRTVDFP